MIRRAIAVRRAGEFVPSIRRPRAGPGGGNGVRRLAGLPTFYSGFGYSARDERRRFVLPPDLRALVLAASNNAPILCVDEHARFPCLTGFGLSRTESFREQVAGEQRVALERGEPFDAELRASQLAAFQTARFDDSGRFILPDFLADAAGITDSLYFHGAGEQIFLWAPAQLMAMGAEWDGAKRKCKAVMAEGPARGGRRK